MTAMSAWKPPFGGVRETPFNIKLVGNVLEMSFARQQRYTNQEILHYLDEEVLGSLKNTQGPLLLLNGPTSAFIVSAICTELAQSWETIAVWDRGVHCYVVTATIPDSDYQIGQQLDAAKVEESDDA